MSECFEAADGVDASNRLLCTHNSEGYRTEGQFAVGRLQLVKCFRAVLKLDHCLLGWFLSCGDWGGLTRDVWHSTHFTADQDRVSHRLRAQFRSAHVFSP